MSLLFSIYLWILRSKGFLLLLLNVEKSSRPSQLTFRGIDIVFFLAFPWITSSAQWPLTSPTPIVEDGTDQS